MDGELPFEDVDGKVAENGDQPFLVDVDGFEGPLDLLLELARRQKVDLAKISILALVDQYLEFIEAARKVRLELAADYLVMAAWLAYLKSRLLLPEQPKGEEPLAADHPLRGFPNTVLSPHVGYVTADNMRGFFVQSVENIRAWQAGAPIRVVNPEVVGRQS